jgi:hypothetical protein
VAVFIKRYIAMMAHCTYEVCDLVISRKIAKQKRERAMSGMIKKINFFFLTKKARKKVPRIKLLNARMIISCIMLVFSLERNSKA